MELPVLMKKLFSTKHLTYMAVRKHRSALVQTHSALGSNCAVSHIQILMLTTPSAHCGDELEGCIAWSYGYCRAGAVTEVSTSTWQLVCRRMCKGGKDTLGC